MKIVAQDRGYRYSLDPFILASFVNSSGRERLIDLGAGNGIIPLLLARRLPLTLVTALEIQENLVRQARINIEQNGFSHRISLVRADIGSVPKLLKGGSYDQVVSNPPFRRGTDGKINPEKEKAIARHEILLTLAQVVTACRHLAKPGGKITLIYHPYRLTELFAELKRENLKPKRMRFVHARPQKEAKMVMIEAIKGGNNDLDLLPPFIIYGDEGGYSEEMEKIYREGGAQGP